MFPTPPIPLSLPHPTHWSQVSPNWVMSSLNEDVGICVCLVAAALGDVWSDEGLLEIDRTLPEGAETSSVCEISSHVCESFFMSPENTLECEQPIRRVYQSLSTAVEGLLEMALDSSKQVRPTPHGRGRWVRGWTRQTTHRQGCMDGYITTDTEVFPTLMPACRLQ